MDQVTSDRPFPHNKELICRDALLGGVAEAARRLLSISNFDAAVNGALEAIATAADIDRVFVYQHQFDTLTQRESELCVYEWSVTGTVKCHDIPGQMPMFYDEVDGDVDCLKDLKSGHPVHNLVRYLSDAEQKKQESELSISGLKIPMFIEDIYWGNVDFDDCTTERIWSDADITVLKMAVTFIASAIERDRNQNVCDAAETGGLLERETVAQARGAELAKVNHVLQETLDTLVTEPELSRFLGYILQAIALQFDSPFLEYWRNAEDNLTYLELVVVNSEVLIGDQLVGHHGVDGLTVSPGVIEADNLFQRTQYLEIDISPTNPFVEPFYDNLQHWCHNHGFDLPGKVFNFPVVLGEKSFGAIAIFLPKERALSKETIELGYALTNQAALAVQLTQLAEETQQIAVLEERGLASQQRQIELSQVNSVLKTGLSRLAKESDLNAFLGHVIHTINQAVGAATGHVFLHDTTANTLELLLSVTQGDVCMGAAASDPAIFHGPFPADITQFYPNVCLNEIGLTTNIIEADTSLMWPGTIEWLQQSGYQEAAAIALISGSRPVGLLGLSFTERATFTDEDLDLIRALADQASLAIQLAGLAEETKQTAILQAQEAATQVRASELEAHNLVLEGRDRILQAIATASNLLLTAESLGESINSALRVLGEGIGCDRVGVLENFGLSVTQLPDFQQVIYEWTRSGTIPQISHGEAAKINCEGLSDFLEKYLREDGFGGLVDEWDEPLRSIFKAVDIASSYSVPIWLDERFWGVIGFDYCKTATCISPAEMAVLRTAAACIGSAIKRDRSRLEREAATQARVAELAERDRILKATAEAANALLTVEEFDCGISTALQIIGQAVDTDRVGIAEHVEDLSDGNPGFWQVVYEWYTPQLTPVSQIYHPQLMHGTYEGAEVLYELQQNGEGFSLTIDELLDPFRSSMEAVGVQSLHSVPIFLHGHYWGTVVFGDCREKRHRNDAELTILKTIADCIGSAIEREKLRHAEFRNRKERDAASHARAVELETYNQKLRQRDSLLNSVNAAAQCLLADDNLSEVFPKMLKILGEGTQQCRAYILQNSLDRQTGELLFNLSMEWDAPNIPTKIEAGGRFPVPVSHFPFHLREALREGRATQFLARELDGLKEREKGQALALVGVPINVEGEWWGVLGLDDCIEERVWSTAEIAVLETAASCIGSALERDRTRKARELAERESLIAYERAARAADLEAANKILSTRDRWLEATAIAASQLLSAAQPELTVNAALKTIGDNLECDRLGVMRYLPTDHDLGSFRLLYEWDSLNISRQMATHELIDMPARDFRDWVEHLMMGESVGGLISEQDDPFRSKMQALGTQFAYAVPIFIGGDSGQEFWGLMFMDYCREARQLTPAELSVFNTAATCVGTAIHREQIQRDREQAERNALLEYEREQATQARAAQLQKSNEILSLRERWLEITAAAANKLLLADDLESAIAPTMQILGEGIDADRVGIMKTIERDGAQFYGMYAEWTSAEQPSQTVDEELQEIPAEILGDRLNELLTSGHWVGGDLDDDGIFPEALCEGLKSLGIQTSYSVPIFVSGYFWGVIGIDHCREKRLLTDTEISVFQTIASCFGNAIQREQILHARETAERSALIERERAARANELEVANQILLIRDRWLETTAEVANQLLSKTDLEASVQAALATIGENLECDRVYVRQRVTEPNAPLDGLGFARMIYEWHREGMESYIDQTHLRYIPSESFHDSVQKLLAGQWVGGIIDELEEPVRSYQQSLGIKSSYSVPVIIEGEVWGVVSIDHCRKAKYLNSAELAVFKTAATCIGSAIYQADVRRDWAAQERAKLLGSVAEAANLLLCSADYTMVLPDVVRLLGEAVECDRCAIGQGIIQPNTEQLAIRLRSEWKWSLLELRDCPESILYEDELFSWEDAPYIMQALKKDEVVNTLVADLPEPDRSLIESLGGVAELFVPIKVDQEFWGFITFNNCSETRLYGDAEVAILRLAAESIAAAISRQVQDASIRESEERYRTLFEVSSEGFYRFEYEEPVSISLPIEEQIRTMELNFTIAECNRTYVQMFGLENPEDFVGIKLTDVRAPGSEENLAFLRAYVQNGYQIQNYESQECGQEGEIIHVLNNVIGFVKDGYTYGGWGSQLDITKLKQAQKAQETAEKAILQEQEKAARDRAAELAKTNEAISRTLSALAANPEINEFLGLLLKELATQTGACKTHLFLYDAGTNTLSQHSCVQDGELYLGAAPSDPDMFTHPFPAHLTAAWQAILESPTPLSVAELGVLDHTEQNLEFWWPETIPWHRNEGHRDVACARMLVGEQPIGYIGFAFRDPVKLTSEQLEFIQALTNQATLSIHLTRLADDAKQTAILQEQEKAARDRATELAKANEAISQTLNALAGNPEINDFLGLLLRELAQQTGACITNLFLYDADTHTLKQHSTVHNNQWYLGVAPSDPEMFQTPIPADLTEGWNAVVNSPQPLIFSRIRSAAFEDLSLCWPETIAWHRQQGHRTAVYSRLKVGERPIGFIGFAFRTRAKLKNEKIEFIQTLTHQATLAIQLTNLAEQNRNTALIDERNRLAREIHDTLAQAFTGISLQLEAAKGILQSKPEVAQTHLQHAGDLTRRGLSEARRSVRALRSEALETDALADALQKTLTEISQGTQLQTQFQLQGTPFPLPEDIQLNLLRIGQEAMTNTIRHAQAQTLTLTLTFAPETISLRIVDDGVGFNIRDLVDVTGFGLIGIRERSERISGELKLTSETDIGTMIEVILPLDNRPDNEF